ncbi:MAG: hypothetical protein LPK19_02885, partial [Hymenobacteraceae bacterium]|nr:hypothetical protein [Hymenobacteraceae bacterium]MDX5395129.1 hypothetical protein [Hymenobacteraceae bacterium]MDX5511170.1 hypothetical protein [Hymenobacteraceae bacterium]
MVKYLIIVFVVLGLALPAQAQQIVCENTFGDSTSTINRNTFYFADTAANHSIVVAGYEQVLQGSSYIMTHHLSKINTSCDTVWSYQTPHS